MFNNVCNKQECLLPLPVPLHKRQLAHLQTSMPKQQHHKKLRRVVPSCLDDPPAPARPVGPTFPLGNAGKP